MTIVVIKNIGRLLAVPPGPLSGSQMRHVPVIQSAALAVGDGIIRWFGPESELPAEFNLAAGSEGDNGDRLVDAGGGCVIPGLIDCHTHTVFTGSREHEFVQRIEGRSYLEIAQSGGGIRSTMQQVRAASRQSLMDQAQVRLRTMLAGGVTTVEIKSGYGLTVDDELKMLEAIADLDAQVPTELVGTYLAAHTVPPEFEGDPDGYLDQVLAPAVLQRIANEGWAEFSDVFCERGAFDIERSRRVLTTCRAYGLLPRMHADQITQMGASRLAAEVRAVSADHLECIDEPACAALKAAGTIAVLLPACSFFLGVPPAPARTLIDSGVPVALATDYNPGSSMVMSLPLTLSIACTQMRMTPTECLTAATANAAAALNRQGRIGAIAVGMQADLAILDATGFEQFCYEVGCYRLRCVVKNGLVVFDASMP